MSGIIYAIVKGDKRKQQLESSKNQYKNYRGYAGRRFMKESGDAYHFTMRSVYQRHKSIMEKYAYDFDPKSNVLLK
jgi:hypothetical protein